MTAEGGANLEGARRALFERRLARLRSEREAATAEAPLTWAQERFWFLDQLEPGSAEHNVTAVTRLTGRLDLDLLERALAHLVARHPALRARFVDRGEGPRLVVAAPAELGRTDAAPLELLPPIPEAALAERARAFHRRPFDLSAGPTWRLGLAPLEGPGARGTGEPAWVALLGLHHIVTDGWSMGILARDLGELYGTLARGEDPGPVAGGDSALGDLARAEHERLAGARLDELVAHWRRTLEGAPTRVSLPTDRPHPRRFDADGFLRMHRLGARTSARLRELARSSGATPYQLLLTLFGVFLARLADRPDLVVGTSYAGRDRPGSAGVVGALVQTLCLRLRPDLDRGLEDALAATRGVLRSAIEHAELPFERLVHELGAERDPRHTPLFNCFFDLVVRHELEPFAEGPEFEELTVDLGQAPFDLALAADPGSPGATGPVELRWQARSSLFDPPTIDRLHAAFERMVDAALADPAAPLGRLPLAEPAGVAERARPTPAPPFVPVGRDLAAAAAAHAERLAIEDGDRTWTHARLEAKALDLAAALGEALGHPPPGTPVAVSIARSAETLLALRAIWQAGWCYVPLEPTEPAPRRAAKCRALSELADEQEATEGQLPVLVHGEVPELPPGTRVLDLAELTDPAKPGDALPEPAPEDPAYVIFTSGSTGEPKGVVVPYGALANHLAWARAAFAFGPDDRFLLRTPLGFDASIWELVHPQVAGACMVVARSEEARDGRLLLELAERSGATVLQSIPSMLRAWLIEPTFARLTRLRVLISAGEALPHELADEVHRRWREAGCGARLSNLYGPTETCIDATWETLDPDRPARAGGGRDSVPIGRSLPGFGALVVDGRGEPAAVGCAGELLLCGAGLARGYLGLEEATARAFVELEVGGERRRWYRTGDRARRLADGRLEALGREDGQVKLRGMRVEVGEIETCLRGAPGVHDAAVVAVDPRGAGDPQLVAFVAGEAEPDDLRSWLAERLPDHMVPRTTRVLAALPLTASEKTDRRLLEERARDHFTGAPVAGRTAATETERFLAEELARLLERDQPTPVDLDLFALGGHSLLAARLLATARARFGRAPTLADFLERPTLERLAAGIEADAPVEEAGAPAGSPDLDTDGPVPLSRAQERLWILDRRAGGHGGYTMPGALELRGPLDPVALAGAVDDLVARQAVLGTNLRALPAGSPWSAEQVTRAEPPRLELLPAAPAEEAEARLATELAREAARVFDLEHDPLLVLRLLPLGRPHPSEPERHALVFNLHHALGDAWSLEVLERELGELYAARLAGRPPALEPLARSFADLARAERQAPSDAADLAAWEDQLTGCPALAGPLDLPRRHGPGDLGRRPVAVHAVHLGPDLARALDARARDLACGRGTLLLAAWSVLIGRLASSEDLCLSISVAGRDAPGAAQLVGFFVSAMPLRVDLTGAPDLAALAERVRRATTFALGHAGPGLDALLDHLGLETPAGSTPLFQVGFDHLPVGERGEARPLHPDLPELEVRTLPSRPTSAKLDLHLEVEDATDGLTARLELDARAFEPELGAAWLAAWAELLDAMLRAPKRPVGELLAGPQCPDGGPLEEPEGELVERLANEAAAKQGGSPGDACTLVTHGGREVTVRPEALAARAVATARRFGWSADTVLLVPGHATCHEHLDPVLAGGAAGARVVAAAEPRTPRAWLELAAAEGVTDLVGPASWLEALVELEGGAALAACPDLVRLVALAEPAGADLRAGLARLAAAPELWQAYGTAEAGACALTHRLDGPDLAWSASAPPVGRPRSGLAARVVDGEGRDLPTGAEGELWLAGAGLALEAARPGTDTAVDDAGRTWLRTGDRARTRADRDLVLAGRLDRRLVRHGQAFDPVEVELALGRLVAVSAAAVRAEGDELIAHLEAGTPPRLAELRAHARRTLPRALWPTRYLVHAELPRGPGGRLDLAALADGRSAGRLLEGAPVAPIADPAERSARAARLGELFAAELPGTHDATPPDPAADFFDLGGSSLGAIRLLAGLHAELGLAVDLESFFAAPTLGDLLALEAGEGPTAADPDVLATMERDALLGTCLAPAPGPGRDSGARLLTGATGFLGAFLLTELLEAEPDRELRCLVRAPDETTGRERLAANLVRYGLPASLADAVRVVPGDLAEPRFGLDDEAWRELGTELGLVLHSGAAVDFLRDYAALVGPNVEGTRTAVDLAMAAGAALDLVSTVGVVASAAGEERDEATPLARLAADQEGGYERTKWVAEALVAEAARRGLDTRCLRPGRVAAAARRSSGAGNPDDFAGRFLAGCLELGLAPDLGGLVDVVPVDHLARVIVALGRGGAASSGSTWHLVHPEPAPYGALFEAARRRGADLELVPLATWLAAVDRACPERLAPVASLLRDLDEAGARAVLSPDRDLATVDSSTTHRRLTELGLTWPPIDAAWCDAALERLGL